MVVLGKAPAWDSYNDGTSKDTTQQPCGRYDSFVVVGPVSLSARFRAGLCDKTTPVSARGIEFCNGFELCIFSEVYARNPYCRTVSSEAVALTRYQGPHVFSLTCTPGGSPPAPRLGG